MTSRAIKNRNNRNQVSNICRYIHTFEFAYVKMTRSRLTRFVKVMWHTFYVVLSLLHSWLYLWVDKHDSVESPGWLDDKKKSNVKLTKIYNVTRDPSLCMRSLWHLMNYYYNRKNEATNFKLEHDRKLGYELLTKLRHFVRYFLPVSY